MAQTNELLSAINKELAKRPSFDDICEALQALKRYNTIRLNIVGIFQSYSSGLNYRIAQVNQYLAIRALFESIGIKFTNDQIKQRADTKQFNIEWDGDKTAALFWSNDSGWSVDTRKYGQELGKKWDSFDFSETLANNNLNLESDEFNSIS